MKKIKRSSVQKGVDYFLLFLLIANSGIQFFAASEIIQIFLFFFSFAILIKRKINLDTEFFLILLLFLAVEIIQILLHGGFDYVTFAGTYVKLGMIYFIVKLLKYNFDKYYINILYFFTLVSLIFYTFSFVPGFTEYFVSNVAPFFKSPFVEESVFYKSEPTIIIFCFEDTLMSDHRNSGPFWEPGAFAVFLCIALLFNIIRTGKMVNRKNILFIVAILTTLSTAGYIALAAIFGGFYTIKRGFLNKVMVLLLVVISGFLFSRLDFLEQKINQNIDIAEKTTSSRFGSALADYKLFVESPLVGWGRGDARYGEKKVTRFTIEEHRNNGIFILLATYGIILTVIYFFLIYKSINALVKYRNFTSWFSFISMCVIFILGFSQGIFSLPLLYSFLFLHINYKTKVLKIRKEINFNYY